MRDSREMALGQVEQKGSQLLCIHVREKGGSREFALDEGSGAVLGAAWAGSRGVPVIYWACHKAQYSRMKWRVPHLCIQRYLWFWTWQRCCAFICMNV